MNEEKSTNKTLKRKIFFNLQIIPKNRCSRCEAGSVSFGDPYTTKTCTLCLEGTYECLGGATVSANPGYWRSDENSLDVYQCQLESACL